MKDDFQENGQIKVMEIWRRRSHGKGHGKAQKSTNPALT